MSSPRLGRSRLIAGRPLKLNGEDGDVVGLVGGIGVLDYGVEDRVDDVFVGCSNPTILVGDSSRTAAELIVRPTR